MVIELVAKRKQNVYLNADKRAEIERLFKEGYGSEQELCNQIHARAAGVRSDNEVS